MECWQRREATTWLQCFRCVRTTLSVWLLPFIRLLAQAHGLLAQQLQFLRPFLGPNSVITWNNCRTHLTNVIKAAVAEKGIRESNPLLSVFELHTCWPGMRMLQTLPYDPWHQLAEYMFGIAKCLLRKGKATFAHPNGTIQLYKIW